MTMSADNIILIKPEELYNEASGLRYDAKEPMDYLRDIVGMDWGEEGLGALYYLECTATGSRRVLKAVAADRENPFLPSVCHLWKTAKIKEREVFDFFGIRFTTRGVRFLRHPLHGKSGHAPHLPARGLEGIPSAQGLRYGLQSAEHGE